MLTYLIIRDFAIIDHLEIPFHRGFTAITGETGAGKSILINALNLVLGGRASADVIRAGEERAVVEATFELSEARRVLLHSALEQRGIEVGEELFVRRIVNRSGRNRVFINGSVVNVATLQETMRGLVDISGQHEHYSLLYPEEHINVLDSFGGLEERAGRVASEIDKLSRLRSEVKRLQNEERQRLARVDFLRFQLGEISRDLLDPDQEKIFADEAHMLRHAEMLRDSTHEVCQQLYEGQYSALDAISSATATLQRLQRYDSGLESIVESLDSARIQFDDATRDLRTYHESLNVDPERLEQLEEMLYAHQQLKRKYGDDHEEISAHVKQMRSELKTLERASERIEEATHEARTLRQQVMAEARTLSQERTQAARHLEESVESELSYLGMGYCRFKVKIEHTDGDGRSTQDISLLNADALNSRGLDQVEFMLRPNPGAGWGPLAKIASGGELSRIMLAIKTGLMMTDPVETYVFDEVDSGIGGATADIVGEKISAVAESKQVICITHLPQIASYSGQHLKVEKVQRPDSTSSTLRELTFEERVLEIARMLGGRNKTRAAMTHAHEMIARSSQAVADALKL